MTEPKQSTSRSFLSRTRPHWGKPNSSNNKDSSTTSSPSLIQQQQQNESSPALSSIDSFQDGIGIGLNKLNISAPVLIVRDNLQSNWLGINGGLGREEQEIREAIRIIILNVCLLFF